MLFAGDSEFSVRFLSLFFGALTVPLLFVTARRLFDGTTALVAALLATLSPLYLWYSQETRMYTLITFLLLLSSYLLLRATEKTRWGAGAGMARADAGQYSCGLYHYFALAVIAFQIVYALIPYRQPAGSVSRGLNLPRSSHEFPGAGTRHTGCTPLCFSALDPFMVTRFGQDVSYWQGALKLDEAVRHILISLTPASRCSKRRHSGSQQGGSLC